MPVVLAYDIQYFFMGIWFPLGIAVFHGSNLRFLYFAKRQKRWMVDGVDEKDGCDGAGTSFLCRIRNWPYVRRVMAFIGVGMVAQVCEAVVMLDVVVVVVLTMIGVVDCWHVVGLQEVSSHLRHPWNGDQGRDVARAND